MPVTMSSTKQRILQVAVQMFSENSYDMVSMRDIAQAVGIKAASIYNHFPSKNDILKSSYDFFARQQQLLAPGLEDLLLLTQTKEPFDVLKELYYNYPAEIQETMNRILIIAGRRIYADEESECFIRKYLFEYYLDLLIPLLSHMTALGKLEPFDVESFSCLLTYYAFSAALLNHSTLNIGREKWERSLEMVFSLLKATGTAEN
jgi:AcrR family transcriptional regulator